MQVPPPPGLPPSGYRKAPPSAATGLPDPLQGSLPPVLPQQVQLAGGLPLVSTSEATQGTTVGPTNPEEAAKAFASILFGYMFAEMRPKEEDSLLGGGDTEMFMDFFDQAMARNFVDQGNPLVDLIVDRLTPREAGKTETGKGEAGPS